MTLKPRAPRGLPRVLETRSAAKAVTAVLELHHITDEVRAGRLLTEWSELVGPKISQHTRPEGVRDRVLWVEVASSAWMQELNLLKAQILAGLLTRLGEPKLFDDLRFKLAGRSRRESLQLRAKRPPPKPAKPLPPPATGATRETIVREAATIEDEELRELVARLRITHDK